MGKLKLENWTLLYAKVAHPCKVQSSTYQSVIILPQDWAPNVFYSKILCEIQLFVFRRIRFLLSLDFCWCLFKRGIPKHFSHVVTMILLLCPLPVLSLHSIIPAVHLEFGQNHLLLKKIVCHKSICYLTVSVIARVNCIDKIQMGNSCLGVSRAIEGCCACL